MIRELSINGLGTLGATPSIRTPADLFAAILPALTDDRGNWTPFEAAAQLYDTVEIRTTVTPPITLQMRELGSGSPNPVAARLKPTLILRGPAGTKLVAPYGPADATSGAVVGFGVLFGALALAAGVGYAAGRRRGKR